MGFKWWLMIVVLAGLAYVFDFNRISSRVSVETKVVRTYDLNQYIPSFSWTN
jgi:hypothetical protein